ncbi:MAG TPA: hypothetical protein VJV78_16720, partial [Polyangiales bacterium]|nr:hypothetical protein [Polyangiales bacterium]
MLQPPASSLLAARAGLGETGVFVAAGSVGVELGAGAGLPAAAGAAGAAGALGGAVGWAGGVVGAGGWGCVCGGGGAAA